MSEKITNRVVEWACLVNADVRAAHEAGYDQQERAWKMLKDSACRGCVSVLSEHVTDVELKETLANVSQDGSTKRTPDKLLCDVRGKAKFGITANMIRAHQALRSEHLSLPVGFRLEVGEWLMHGYFDRESLVVVIAELLDTHRTYSSEQVAFTYVFSLGEHEQ